MADEPLAADGTLVEETNPSRDTSHLLESATNAGATNTYARDGEYFKPDGDCVFLVDGVLFKIHSVLVGRDSSAFEDMLALPNKGELAIRGSEEEPIELHGDTRDQFRALCWALYALPTEIYLQSTTDMNLARMLDVAEMSNKYHFKAFEKWSIDMVAKFCLRNRKTHEDYLTSCPPESIARILRLAVLCHRQTFQGQIERIWIARLDSSDSASFTHAIEVADSFGLRDFQGHAYYHQLLAMSTDAAPDAGGLSTPFTHSSLNGVQLMRLLSGHWSLTMFWARFAEGGVKIPAASGCDTARHHPNVCVKSWQARWAEAVRSEAVLALRPCDALGKCRALQAILGSESVLHGWANVHCRHNALQELQDVVAQLQETLADHFLGPLKEDAPDEAME
ncbi:hypothetical protein HDZ31DRAFT_37367 [Schizophyllum fasciatum]